MTATTGHQPLLAVRGLEIEFPRAGVRAVRGLELDVAAGEVVGVVGESGCGKTVAALSVLGLLPASASVTGGEIRFRGRDLLALRPRELRRLRGREIAMIYQDPLTSLHPAFTVGAQLAEAIRTHDRAIGRRGAQRRVVELLDLVGIPEPGRRVQEYPHEWSGGMRQRAMIAMAVANRPSLLIADEPTTALDVTVQAQILDVLRDVIAETGTAVVLITHDFGVVAELCDRVTVLYAGAVVETGTAHDLFHRPQHPYTEALLAAVPRLDRPVGPVEAVGGQPPTVRGDVTGCAFEPRCPLGRGVDVCNSSAPALVVTGPEGRRVACHRRLGGEAT